MAISYSGADASLYTKNVSQDKAIAINRNGITSINEGGSDIYLRSDESDTMSGSLTVTGGITANGATVWDKSSVLQDGGLTGAKVQTASGYIDFGPANTSFAHIYTDRPSFYFNTQLDVLGSRVWNAGNDGAGSGLDADTVDGIQGANFLRSDTSDTMTGSLTVTGDIFATGTKYEGDAKEIIRFSDAWLRLNPANEFTAGIYCGTGVLRTDGSLQVGSSGANFLANSSTLSHNGSAVWTAANAQLTTTGNAIGCPKNMYNNTGASLADNVTTSSTGLRFTSWNATVIHSSSGLVGTWRNITGRTVANTHVGTFVRIS